MFKKVTILALAAVFAAGGHAFGAAQTGSPSKAETDALTAARKVEDPVARVAAIRKFLVDYPSGVLAASARQALVPSLVAVKAPTAELLAAAEQAVPTMKPGTSRAMLHNLVAMELAERGEKLDVALDYATKALADVPTEPDFSYIADAVRDTLGWVHVKRGEYDKAIALLSQAAASAGESQEILYHLGVAYEKAGRSAEALEAYTRAAAVFLGRDKSAEEALRALYSKTHGSLDGLEAKLEAARARSRQVLAFDSRRHDKPAPAWELKDMSGKPVRFVDFKGKVVVMDFWGSWCPPCRLELPHFQRLYDEYKDRGVVFLGMNWEQPGPADEPFTPAQKLRTVREFMTKNGYTFPVVIDHDRAAVQALGVNGYPTVFIVDSSGTIRFKNVGYDEGVEQILKAQIESLLQ